MKFSWFARGALSCAGWCALAVLLLGGRMRAEDYSVTSWGVDEGLPQSSVTDIAQTPDGFLWIGTLISGLSRFDGVQFVNFDSANTPGLVNPGVRRLLVDAEGRLWVNDYGGNLLVMDKGKFVKVGENFRLGSLLGERGGRLALATIDGELVIGRPAADGQWDWHRYRTPAPGGAIYGNEDRDGVIWFQAPGGKIYRFSDGRFEGPFGPANLNGLTGSRIQAITSDQDGRIWIGTDAELACWEHGAFTNMNPDGLPARISVRRIIAVNAGGLWVEADGKFYFRQNNHWSGPVEQWDGNRAPWSHFRTLRPDHDGSLWISLGDEGLVHLGRDGQLVRVTSAAGLPSQLVQTMFADHEGNLWAGYHRGGLIQLRKQTFHTVARSAGLLDTLVTSVTEDTDGAIWMGTAGGSVARWANGVCKNFTLPLLGAYCQDVVVCAGSAGRVWIGTGGNGLLVRDAEGFHHVLTPGQIPQGVRQLLETANGDVWLANLSQVCRFANGKLETVLTTKTTAEAVAALKEGADGAIWVGTFGGTLERLQNGKVTRYQPQDNQPPTRFWALCAETNGTLWVGTMNGGLLRFRDGKFTRFTRADGLAADNISHILADNLGHLWLGSQAGVMCIDEASLVPADERRGPVACRLFGRSDGLPTVAMTLEFQPSCVKAHDGTLWFGSPKGTSWVNPADVRPIQPPPPVLLSAVLADGVARSFAHAGASAPPVISVEPGVKNIEVQFTSPEFTAPRLMRFKYRLDQLDPDWIDVGEQRSVTFNHLPAGEYTFRVMAQNSDGLWSGQPAAFRLVVRPYFWQRTSFLITALLFLLLSVALVVRRVTQQRLHRRLELLHHQQQIERERSRIAQDLHDDLGAGLTEISLTSDMATNPSLPEYESRQYTREIGARARELVQSMDEIVWAVNPRNDSVTSLSVYACQYAQRQLKPLNMACRLDVQPGLPELPLNAEQRYNFFLAFKEVINNIARHSGATELHLAIHAEGRQLVFLIEDNGRGFEPGREAAGADGLLNIRERITRLGGECEIKSQPGGGTRVCLRVPLPDQTANRN